MLYATYQGTNDYRPIGIYMTAWGDNDWSDSTARNKSTISIYGGTENSGANIVPQSTTPVVRIGNLKDLPAIDNEAVQGWGIYTTNGFFKGKVVATSGKIGNLNLVNGKLYTNNNELGAGSTNVYIANDGISLGTTFKVTSSGALTAQSGTIGSNATVANNWQIGDRSIYYGNATPGYNASTLVLSTGTTSGKSIGGSGTSTKTWMISAGTGFGVTSAGIMYATGAHIEGEITATSGTIGASNASYKITIGTNATNASIYYGMSSLNSTTTTGFYIGTDGISLGGGKFKVTSAGALTAKSGTIGSNATAANNWQIGDKSIYKGTSSPTVNNSTAVGTYIGTDGILNYASANAYVLLKDGIITAQGANITGTIHATGGEFGDASGYHVKVSSSDVGIFSDANTQIGVFGDTIRIGAEDTQNFQIKTDQISANSLLDLGGIGAITSYWWIDDLMGKTMTYTFTGSGDEGVMYDFVPYAVISSVKVNNTTLSASAYSYDGNYITFNSPPGENSTIVITYTTNRCTPRFCFRNGLPTGPTTNNGWSVTMGFDCWSSGLYAFSTGKNTTASGGGSFACGYNTTASGAGSFACGYNTTASGAYSIACGIGSNASSINSFASGLMSVASGSYSVAIGETSAATGEMSFAINSSVAQGDYSSSFGNTTATRKAQVAIGEYNILDTGGTDTTTRGTYAFIIGNGTAANARSNALTVDWNGVVTATGYRSFPLVPLSGNYTTAAIGTNPAGVIQEIWNELPKQTDSGDITPFMGMVKANGGVTSIWGFRYGTNGEYGAVHYNHYDGHCGDVTVNNNVFKAHHTGRPVTFTFTRNTTNTTELVTSRCTIVDHTVCVMARLKVNASTGEKTVGSIPSAYAPPVAIFGSVTIMSGNNSVYPQYCYINTSGGVVLSSTNNLTPNVTLMFTYQI